MKKKRFIIKCLLLATVYDTGPGIGLNFYYCFNGYYFPCYLVYTRIRNKRKN